MGFSLLKSISSIFLISNFSSIQYNARIAYQHTTAQILVKAVHVVIVHIMRERTNAIVFGTMWLEIDAGIRLDIAGSKSVLFARDRATRAVKILILSLGM